MDISIYQAASAMNASSRWQEVIADNLSASQIAGFKKQDVSFSAVQAGYMGRNVSATGSTGQRFVMPLAGSFTNFQPGEMRRTGTPTDLGVEGSAFFTVQMPDGKLGYTRDGEFRIDTKGNLVSKQGFPVMGESGPLQLKPNGAEMSVNAAGEVYQGSLLKGKLTLTEFGNPGSLGVNGYGYYSATANAQPRQATNSSVRQGFVENANVSTMMEMGNLINAMRFYEANQRVIQNEDDRISRLISQVANPE